MNTNLETVAEAFKEFNDEFSDLFQCHRYDNSETAYQYTCGLVQADKGNLERMEERVVNTDYERFQNFITDSPWDYRAVMNKVALHADELLGGTGETALLIDESGFEKKGNSSACVARQWNGRLGKVENSQVGVFAALSAGNKVVPIDGELFVPKSWVDDPERCEKHKIPEDRWKDGPLTKVDLAYEMVQRQTALGIRFDYIVADGLYGHSAEFCYKLDDDGHTFLMHLNSDSNVYTEDPIPAVPQRRSKNGPFPTVLRAQSPAIRVDKLLLTLTDKDWEPITIRETTKGPLKVRIHRRTIWFWDRKSQEAREWQLVIRNDMSPGNSVKYSLTNAAPETSTLKLARMEAQRYWIEHAFQIGKQEASMGEYQIRGWLGWHHHMALVMLALLFIARCKTVYGEEKPMMSSADVVALLVYFLPKRDITTEEIMRQIEVRHAKREAAEQHHR